MSSKQAYDRKIYEKRRPQIFGNRKCRCCKILLISRFGAQGTRYYCRGCVESGAARRDQNRRHYKKNKKRILQRVKEYQETYKEYRRAYMKRRNERRTVQNNGGTSSLITSVRADTGDVL